MTSSKPKPRTDWESIERDYRAGVLSIREVAKIQGVTDGAIRKKAKAEGWERDLTDKVNAKVKSELVRTEVRSANVRTDREIVEHAAATVVEVVRSHRRGISSAQNIVGLLMAQLTDVAGKRDEFEVAIDIETAEDKTTQRRTQLMKAISIPSHASTVRDLSTAMKNLVGLERQAFNIANEGEREGDSVSELLEFLSGRGNRLPIKS